MQRSLITERKSGQRCWVVMYPALLLHFLVGQLQQFVAIGIRSSVLGALLNLPLSTALTPAGSCMPPVQGFQRFQLPLGRDEVVCGGQLRVLGLLHPFCLFHYGSYFPAGQVDVGWGKGVWAGGVPD